MSVPIGTGSTSVVIKTGSTRLTVGPPSSRSKPKVAVRIGTCLLAIAMALTLVIASALPTEAASLTGNLDGLNVELVRRMQRLANSAGMNLHVISGYRSRSEQQRLYDLYKAGKGNLAAPPGTSFHEFHGAADVRFANGQRPGDTAHLRALTAAAGLSLPVRSEPWHVQVAGWTKAQAAAGPFYKAPASATTRSAWKTDRTFLRILQAQLWDLGHADRATPRARFIDGVWGPKTKGAALALQRKHGISVDGIPGSQTIAAIEREYAAVRARSLVATPTWRTDRNFQRTLQTLLWDLGHVDKGKHPRSRFVDGIWGPNTEAAVRTLQRSSGITVDGIVGPQTLGAIKAAHRLP